MRYRPHPQPLSLMGGERLRIAMAACLAFCFLTVAAYDDYRNARVDSLEAALKSSNPPKGEQLLRAYDELMRGYLPFDSAKASDYGRKALALSYELNGLNVRQNVIRHFAQMHYAREEYDEAVALYQQALAIVDTMTTLKRYTEKDIDDARSTIYGNMGNLYNIQDKAHLAIHYYQLALPIFEKYDWRESQAILYTNIGELYGTMGNEAEALRNYLLAIEQGQASGDSLMVAMPRKGLASLYIGQGNYAKARETTEQCYAYYHAHRTEEPEAYSEVLASMVRLNMMDGHQDLTAAKKYAQEALALADHLRFELQADVYAAACELAMTEKRWKEALGYGLKSIHPDSLAISSDAGCYRLLAEIYSELGQKDKAQEYIQKMNEVMTRYATDHYQSGLSQMEVLYETEKKEARIAQLTSERRLHLWVIGIGCLVLVVTVLLFFYLQLAHRRQKALLAAKVALETEARERHILARDLHDSLGSMLSLLKIKSNSPGTEGNDYQMLLDDIIVEVRRVSHHLMPEELLRSGLESALHDFAVSVPGAHFMATGAISLSKEQELTLYRCAYELVNNALKHAKASHIDIQLTQDEHEVTLTVSDDGKGIQPPPQTPQPTPDTSRKEGGMGLQNIRERIEPYHGVLRIVSNEDDGTEINVTLPL